MSQAVAKTALTGCLAPIDKTGLEDLIAKGKADPKVIKTLKCKTVAEGRFRHLNFIRTLPAYVVDEPPGLLGDGIQRGRPDAVVDSEPSVPLDELSEQLGPDRPAAADVGVVRGDVVQAVGTPVGHQDNGDVRHDVCSWTNAVSRERTSGSVCGRTPWPRLKT